VGLTARFARRDDLRHSLRYAVNCSMLFTEAPWLEPHGSEVRDRTPPREPVCQAGTQAARGSRTVFSGGMHRESPRADLSVNRQHPGAGRERRGGFPRPCVGCELLTNLLTNRFTRVGV
jgi:hypothetical protein